MARSKRARHYARGVIARLRIFRDRHLAIEHGQIQPGAVASAAAVEQGGIDRLGCKQAGGDIAAVLLNASPDIHDAGALAPDETKPGSWVLNMLFEIDLRKYGRALRSGSSRRSIYAQAPGYGRMGL